MVTRTQHRAFTFLGVRSPFAAGLMLVACAASGCNGVLRVSSNNDLERLAPPPASSARLSSAPSLRRSNGTKRDHIRRSIEEETQPGNDSHDDLPTLPKTTRHRLSGEDSEATIPELLEPEAGSPSDRSKREYGFSKFTQRSDSEAPEDDAAEEVAAPSARLRNAADDDLEPVNQLRGSTKTLRREPTAKPAVTSALAKRTPRVEPPAETPEEPIERPLTKKRNDESHETKVVPAAHNDRDVRDEEPAEKHEPLEKREAEKKPDEYSTGDWLSQRERTIAQLEEEIRLAKNSSDRSTEIPRLETLLRLHYALAGKRDEASREIGGLKSGEQEFWKHHNFGLVDLLDPAQGGESRRIALGLKSLDEARSRLSTLGGLSLKNLAFCKRVQDFGRHERFPRTDFNKNQEVLLYVEVEHFAAEKQNDGRFETELQGSFRILDRSGAARAERSLPLDKQTCANHRRDYYIAYRLYMPPELTPGPYTLELTLEDRKGNKSSNGLIEFNIVP